MNKMNPIQKAKYINERYKNYLRSSFKFGNDQLQKLYERQLEEEDLYKGPYVALNLPYQRGKSIRDLMSEGIVSNSFAQLHDINLDRPLYIHQEESIRKISKGRSVVITTGTSSGKTESFLYPILNEILHEIENGNVNDGVRAIFLYPLNALVNDQMRRVRNHLSTYPEITFGFFTGDTEEKNTSQNREKYIKENGPDIPKNELMTREEMRQHPPHLLFTNYSMLEYLLIRPNDYAIFAPDMLNNWKYVVMDEAHTYHGSLGIELSLLMRRLTGLVEKKPQFILTSATLGEKGKSEKDIVQFARNLTSADFDVDDIIFAKRIPLLSENVKYKIDGKDYICLNDNHDNLNVVQGICKKYSNRINENKIEACLFELLNYDENVYNISCLLASSSITFASLSSKLNMNEHELVALIDLINMAKKNGVNIFDLKYHSFVRPLAGAYISLGDKPQLSLTKTNKIGKYRAFEVGNCRYCNSPYLIGKICHNLDTDLDYLLQNKEVDIYENYGDNQFVKIDYFLLDNSVTDEIDTSQLEEYELCAKCGAIHLKSNLNAKKCTCGDENLVTVYRIEQNKFDDDYDAYNNINQCPCCGHHGRAGVVKSLNLGKDEGTALIGQFLFESIAEKESSESIERRGVSLLRGQRTQERIQRKPKQFLSFSDSRQQASFAATFMDSNHSRMLYKRLIWKIIEENNYNDLRVDSLASCLEDIIKNKDLFENELSVHKNAWVAILLDLLRVDGSYDGEGLGLYYFDIDLTYLKDSVTDNDVKDEYGIYNINSVDELVTLIQVLFGVFKVTPAINYTKSSLTPEEKKEHLGYRRFDNYIALKLPEKNPKSNNVRSFLPVKNNSNMISRYLQKTCNIDSIMALEFLSKLFDMMCIIKDINNISLLKKNEENDWYQIDASNYILKNYRSHKFYRCKKCGSLTPYNLHNKCTKDKCDGDLEEINPDDVLADNFYRQQYKNMGIERLVVDEHTGQLDRQTAKQYQTRFKNGEINILSCSTTFEMGIDLGTLENVFMRNIPPSPANYVQRAGRAGRGEDSSAFVITYCGINSHDYTYFCQPENMISGVINPPYFNVLNDKIIIRHLMAASLGFFFRKYEGYFHNLDKFIFQDGVDLFNQYISSHPSDLGEYIDNKVIPESVYKKYHNFQWFDSIDGDDEKLRNFVNTLFDMENEFEKAKKMSIDNGNYQDADYYANQVKSLHKLNLVKELSEYCVIPKYGFPVDVVQLKVYENGKLNKKYDLNRDLKIAISEYAPDSEVVVDRKKFTSKYITQPKVKKFTKYYYAECPNCKKFNIGISRDAIHHCEICGTELHCCDYFIDPIYGFKTGVTKESTRMKPKRSYSGEVRYLGKGQKDDRALVIDNILSAETSTNDEMLVMNKSQFYVCSECGYSEIIKGNATPEKRIKHNKANQFPCKNDLLECMSIGHRFQTDVIRITLPLLVNDGYESQSKALSFLYALLEGVSIALDIERTDIDGLLDANNNTKTWDIIIYDNVSGGAGHVKRLLNFDAILASFKKALDKVSQNCCDEETSCYNCLRNYYNQLQHPRLKRRYAKEILSTLIERMEE